MNKKTFFKIVAGALILLPLLIGCKKNEKPEVPKIKLTAPVVEAEFNGEKVILKWSPVVNATSYKVEYRNEQETEFHVAGSPTYSPFEVVGLEFGNKYLFRVKAVNGDVESEWSELVSADVLRFLPKPVVRADAGISFIAVAWDAVEGATSYSVEHKVSVASEWSVDYTGNETTFKIGNVQSGVSYDVRVGAIAEGYSMSYSEIVTTATSQAPSTLISTGEQLAAWLSSISVETSDVAAIVNDIDMQGITITSASGFAGTLEGQGYAIKNLKSSVPLFAQNSGTIKDVILDESCVFTAGSNEFGALVGQSVGGAYKNVVNKASVTYNATADVDVEIILGGIAGRAQGARFENCSNEGLVSFEAPGCVHKNATLGGIVGLVNHLEGPCTFYACVNSGKISLNAKYGDPVNEFSSTGTGNAIGVNLGGIVGTTSWSEENTSTFEQCINEATAIISLNHSDISPLPALTSGSTGPVGVAGIIGFGQGKFNKCRNLGLIRARAVAEGEPAESVTKKKNYLLHVGGIAGMPWDNLEIESCNNSGNIEVEYDGLYDNDDRWRASAGGICGQGAYGSTGTFAYYCKTNGNITVSGHGTMAVGGIFGLFGKQIKNTVTENCHITVNGRKGDVGGLVGYVAGGAANYTIKGSTCAATIFADSDWGDAGKDWYYCIGGLMGRWGGASGEGSNASMTSRDGDPCVFSGSISSVYQGPRAGVVVGMVRGSGKKVVFGESDNPIKVSGTISWKDVEEVAISAENLDTYKYGASEATTTMYVVCN